MTLLLAALAALGSLLLGQRAEASSAPSPVVLLTPAGDVVVLDLSLDLERLGRDLSTAQQSKLLESVETVLAKRLPEVKVVVSADPETGRPLLRLRTTESSGLTRERLVRLATSAGAMSLQIVATRGDFDGTSTSYDRERVKMLTWRRDHPEAPLADYARVHPKKGGPDPRIRWVWGEAQSRDEEPRPLALLVEEKADWRIGTGDMARFYRSVDRRGHDALGFEVAPERRDDMEAFTTWYENRRLAIVVGDRVLTAPQLAAPLRSGGVVTGGSFGFARGEVDDLVTILTTPLPEVPLIVAPGTPK